MGAARYRAVRLASRRVIHGRVLTGCALAAVLVAACGDGDDAEVRRQPSVECTPLERKGPVVVRPRWSEGDTRQVEVTKSRTDSAEPESGGEYTTRAVVEVLDVGRSGTTLRWSNEDLVLPPMASQFDEDAQDHLAETMSDLEVEYRTDADGAFRRALNVPALRAYANDLFDAIVEWSGGDSDGTEPTDARRLRELFTSDAFVQSALIEDIIVLHGLYGAVLRPGEPVTAGSELPNPFGGLPIPARTTAELVTPRDGHGCAQIHADVVPRRAAIMRLIRDVGVAGTEAPGGVDLRVRQRIDATYDPGSGWIVEAAATKMADVADRHRRDRTVVSVR
jgi:hypothetical protein